MVGLILYWLRAAPSTVAAGLAERIAQRRAGRVRLRLMDRLQLHLRVAFRGLVKQPRLVGLACITLGLGVGANTAMFGVVRQVLLRPLPYLDPDRVLQVSGTQDQEGLQSLSYADFSDLRAMSESFAGMTAVRPWRSTITELRSVPSIVAAQVSQPRLRAFVLVAFGVLATIVTGVGVLGVSTYAMTQRVREIGVRIALGAQRRDVLTLIVGQSVRMTALGITFGVIAALALVRLLSSVLYGVAPMDFFTFGGVALLLTALSLAATYLPARRASRVDPVNSLRSE